MGSVKDHMKPVLYGTRCYSETVDSVVPGLHVGEPYIISKDRDFLILATYSSSLVTTQLAIHWILGGLSVRSKVAREGS